MPTNLTDDQTSYPTSIQAPAPLDPRTSVSVAVPLQQLANRTANLTSRLDALAPYSKVGYAPGLPAGVTSGVSTLLVANDVTSMLSIPAANRANRMCCLVANGGLFVFDIASTATVAAPWVLAPADVTGGLPGRWTRTQFDALAVANGLPQLDSSSRLPAGIPRNGLVAFGVAAPSDYNTSSATFAPITGASIVLPALKVGDVILVRSSLFCSMPAAADLNNPSIAQTQGYVLDPGAANHIVANNRRATSNYDTSRSIALSLDGEGAYTVAADGDHTCTWQASATTSGSNIGFGSQTFTAWAYRP